MWTKEVPSLLSEVNLQKMREALRGGLVCGLHAFYAGGCGPEACAFCDMDKYLETVERSRPGDWFTLWSVTDLGARGLLLLEWHGSPPPRENLHGVEEFLRADPKHEFLAVARIAASEPIKIEYGDIDSFEGLAVLAAQCGPESDLYVLPLSSLEGYEPDGRYFGKHAVVDAKRPNERGEVPSGGPY